MRRLGMIILMLLLPIATQGCVIQSQLRLSQLHKAAMRGDQAAISSLLERGVPVNGVDGEGDTALHKAAKAGHRAVGQILVTHGADVNAQNTLGLTPLHYAASAGHDEVIYDLITQGARLQAKTSFLGATPLHYAAESGRLTTVYALLLQGAPVNAKDKRDDTPLAYAVRRGHQDIVQLLRSWATRPSP